MDSASPQISSHQYSFLRFSSSEHVSEHAVLCSTYEAGSSMHLYTSGSQVLACKQQYRTTHLNVGEATIFEAAKVSHLCVSIPIKRVGTMNCKSPLAPSSRSSGDVTRVTEFEYSSLSAFATLFSFPSRIHQISDIPPHHGYIRLLIRWSRSMRSQLPIARTGN